MCFLGAKKAVKFLHVVDRAIWLLEFRLAAMLPLRLPLLQLHAELTETLALAEMEIGSTQIDGGLAAVETVVVGS